MTKHADDNPQPPDISISRAEYPYTWTLCHFGDVVARGYQSGRVDVLDGEGDMREVDALVGDVLTHWVDGILGKRNT